MLTGDAAVRRGVAEPARLVREFKRRVGDPAPMLLGGVASRAEHLMARLLRATIDAVSEREGGPPDAVAVCPPGELGAVQARAARPGLPASPASATAVPDHRARGRGDPLRVACAARSRRRSSPCTTSAAAPSTPRSSARPPTGSRCSATPRASSSSAASTSTRRSSPTCATACADAIAALDFDDPRRPPRCSPAAPRLRRGEGGAVGRHRDVDPRRAPRTAHRGAAHPRRARVDDPRAAHRDGGGAAPSDGERSRRARRPDAACCSSGGLRASRWSRSSSPQSSGGPSRSTPTRSTSSRSEPRASERCDVSRNPCPLSSAHRPRFRPRMSRCTPRSWPAPHHRHHRLRPSRLGGHGFARGRTFRGGATRSTPVGPDRCGAVAAVAAAIVAVVVLAGGGGNDNDDTAGGAPAAGQITACPAAGQPAVCITGVQRDGNALNVAFTTHDVTLVSNPTRATSSPPPSSSARPTTPRARASPCANGARAPRSGSSTRRTSSTARAQCACSSETAPVRSRRARATALSCRRAERPPRASPRTTAPSRSRHR